MSNFKLNLPTDIPWQRICVTEDMIDPVVCDDRLPAKWQTSLAVFKYVPEDENQLYEKYKITYLKITATITGYQPLDKEIQGTIDWNGVNVSTIPGLTDLLNSYNPCYGAILQVVVGPKQVVVGSKKGRVALADYPFFMDFEPKKRELYEVATDTKEKQSRSIESLNLTKSAGTSQSLEILDVDMGGGGGGGGMQGSYAGTGGGFNVNYTAPSGQWGTKQLNTGESMASRSQDVGQEKRETYSFSTQISQMYHLLDSYHLGTNRAVFFIQPRPHTLEEPSGFVRGPRPVEGIQEFFLVVAQPKNQEDFCVSLRLDTSHLTTTPIMEYERKSEPTSIASASAPVATDHDIPAEYIVGMQACFGACWDVHYQCYRTEANDNVTYNAPSGFRIEGYDDLINDASNGTTNVVITPNQATLNINVQAIGHNCFGPYDVCVNCPETIQTWAASARRQVQVNLVSTTPTRQVGEEQVLMITTRGLCCCATEERHKVLTDERVVGFRAIPRALLPAVPDDKSAGSGVRMMTSALAAGTSITHDHNDVPCAECAKTKTMAAQVPGAQYTIRQANELSGFIRTETLKSLNDPYVVLEKFEQTEFFAKQLEYRVRQSNKGRDLLGKPPTIHLSKQAVAKLAKHFKRDAKTIGRADVLSLRNVDLARILNMDAGAVQRTKLSVLGVTFQRKTASKKGPSSATKR